MNGEVCEFTPLERLFGIYSVGHLAVFAATVDYIPGESPLFIALLAASESLSFGPRGGDLTFASYATLVAALAEADAQDFFRRETHVRHCLWRDLGVRQKQRSSVGRAFHH